MLRIFLYAIGAIVLALGIGYGASFWQSLNYAYLPSLTQVQNAARINQAQSYDLWGEAISQHQATAYTDTEDGAKQLSPKNGAIALTPAMLDLGRRQFYQETFGNEIFLTEVLGVTNGPLRIGNVVRALLALGGRGTSNLRVALATDFTAGDRHYRQGELIDTGLDVPKGAFAPLGMPIRFRNGRLRVGISCALCHTTVDSATGRVLEGVVNQDLQVGLLMAMATNSAAYYTHAEVPSLQPFITDPNHTVRTSDGQLAALPDPQALESAVDKIFVSWPPGSFDSTTDLTANATHVPDSFTLGDHPYGWSGFAQAGPFRGLSVLTNNVHAQNSDSLTQLALSKPLFGIDPELYIGLILQNAANPRYRFDRNRGEKPSEFLNRIDPTPGVVGMNEMIAPPTFPQITPLTMDGLMLSSPGYHVWEQVNAISAFENTLSPPSWKKGDPSLKERGRAVFEQAGCATCHSGAALTNNQVVSATLIQTEPTRARAFAKTQAVFAPAATYTWDTPVPIPAGANTILLPAESYNAAQLALALAHNGTPGGYKTPSLIGLAWSAPYLHDGSVAVGADAATQVGVTGTLKHAIAPDPANSLLALIDRQSRQKVIDANQADPELRAVRVWGGGHAFWIDQGANFTPADQQALIEFLLTYQATP